MKKLLLLCCLFTLNAFSQSSAGSILKHIKHSHGVNSKIQQTSTIINLKDSAYLWSWDISASSWGYPYRMTYGYNSVYKENNYFASLWDGFMWNNNQRHINYLFDSNNNLLSKENQMWGGSSWTTSGKTTNTYDASNNLLTVTGQTWNTGNLSWDNNDKTTNTYDASNNLLTSTYQNWNTGMSAWINAYKYVSTYNTNKKYTSYTDYTWNTTTSSWDISGKMINIVYSGGDFTGAEYHVWNTSTLAFEPVAKIAWTYDSNHHLLSDLSYSWATTTNSWVTDYKTSYTYDSNWNMVTTIGQNWDMSTSAWVNSFRQYDYYTSFVGVKELTTQSTAIVYPNPMASELIIESMSGADLNSDYVLFDGLGRVAIEGAISSNKTIINTSGLEKGFYTLTLTNDKGIMKSLKLIK